MTGSRRNGGPWEARYSLHEGLPASFEADPFTADFVRSFDDVLAPVHATVDDLDAYIDPQLAPTDFLEWLGGWFGTSINRRWPMKRRREFVHQAVAAYLLRGTAEGIALAVELYTGLVPTVTDNGGVSSSAVPEGPLPGTRDRNLVVTVEVDATVEVDEDLIDSIVADAKPAHVPHTIRVNR
ncbi:MAG: phage tail protein [Actinomycetota bacterium]